MNVFRLVLFLAGLVAYLVAKQWLQSSRANASPSTVPASNVRHTASCPVPATGISKSEHGLVEVRK